MSDFERDHPDWTKDQLIVWWDLQYRFVKEFQRKYGLLQDGLAGPSTFKKLILE